MNKDTLSLLHIIKVQDADIYQADKKVLAEVSFDIEKGAFVYLLGKTGSGKSSLLKTLYADLPLKKGSAEVVGFDVSNIKRNEIAFLRRKIGIIFQDFQLLTDRDIEQNLKFVLKATGWKDKNKIQKRIEEVLTLVNLADKLKKMPYQLSGGEQQRVVIARALLNEPLILLADEPTGNLDPEISMEILQVFQKINRSGTAILMATHNYTFLENYPADTLLCEQGKLVKKKY